MQNRTAWIKTTLFLGCLALMGLASAVQAQAQDAIPFHGTLTGFDEISEGLPEGICYITVMSGETTLGPVVARDVEPCDGFTFHGNNNSGMFLIDSEAVWDFGFLDTDTDGDGELDACVASCDDGEDTLSGDFQWILTTIARLRNSQDVVHGSSDVTAEGTLTIVEGTGVFAGAFGFGKIHNAYADLDTFSPFFGSFSGLIVLP